MDGHARAVAAGARQDAGLARTVADHKRDAEAGPHLLAAEFVKIGKLLLTAATVDQGMKTSYARLFAS